MKRLPLTIAGTMVLSFALAAVSYAEINDKVQMLLGNPDHADAKNSKHFLIKRPQYALSYNDELHFPNWVSWKLDASDIGREPRGQFQPDNSLPSNFSVITSNDYTSSGYDRGHNCPSADRSASSTDNAAVFLMSNMTPQAHGMNAGPWEKLESESRELAKRGNSLYILAGHGFSSPRHNTMGKKGIAVPDFGWKVVVIVPRGKKIDQNCRVIAVRMPNINTIAKKSWQEYITTAGDIEKATGLLFFDALPSKVAAALRARRDGKEKAQPATPEPSKAAGEITIEEATKKGYVWVNLSSKKYWMPGTQFYGKTKRGKFLSEADAKAAGYVAVKEQ
ncbi:MAG: DNA/RNA non-specific endonuclease [Armatimonas sp.]